MKKIKKVLAMIMAMAMIMGLGMTAFAANGTAQISVSGLAATGTNSVKYYKILEADTTNESGYDIVDGVVLGSYATAKDFLAADIDAQKAALVEENLGTASTGSVTGTTFTANVEAGYYAVFITNTPNGDDPEIVYTNPMIVSVEYNKATQTTDGYEYDAVAGENSKVVAKYTTIPLLKSLGIKKLDFLFLTHGDMDHMGEVFYLINHFKTEKIYINLGEFSPLENNLRKETKVAESKQDSVFQVGTFTLYQLNKSWKDENSSSSVYYIEHPNLTFLSMGDATIDTEKYLSKNYDLDIDVLKIGHHGSKTSTGNSFLNATSPRLALISVGQDNNYGHPNQEVLRRLENKNISYLMTKDSGTITIFPKTEVIIEDKKLQ